MKAFDRQFGKTALESLPATPGIYRFFNAADELIYVGKAKNLRRRLSQYRNAKRRKAHAKMRKIVNEARRFEHEVCANEFEALRLENEIIQAKRPKWNVAGAFYFLYPMLGIRVSGGELHLCYTTNPETYPEYRFHGAYRSRERTREGFFALIELLRLVGHATVKRRRIGTDRNSRAYVYGFRQIPSEWQARLEKFLSGESFEAIEELSLLLLERPTAVARRVETQERLHEIRRFWRHEALVLRKVRDRAKWKTYPVSQKDRDLLFIEGRAARMGVALVSRPPTEATA